MSSNKSVSIKISIDAKTNELKLLKSEFDSLDTTTQRASKQIVNFKDKVDILAHSTQSLIGVTQIIKATFDAIATPVKEYARITDSMKLLESRIKLVASASDDYNKTTLYNTIAKEPIKVLNFGGLFRINVPSVLFWF